MPDHITMLQMETIRGPQSSEHRKVSVAMPHVCAVVHGGEAEPYKHGGVLLSDGTFYEFSEADGVKAFLAQIT